MGRSESSVQQHNLLFHNILKNAIVTNCRESAMHETNTKCTFFTPKYCIGLYFKIYKAILGSLAVMIIQSHSQHNHFKETEKFSGNGQKWINHLPKSQPEFVGEGYSTREDLQLQKHGV